MRAELGELIGMPEERENAVADQIGGGEIAGNPQQFRRSVRTEPATGPAPRIR